MIGSHYTGAFIIIIYYVKHNVLVNAVINQSIVVIYTLMIQVAVNFMENLTAEFEDCVPLVSLADLAQLQLTHDMKQYLMTLFEKV